MLYTLMVENKRGFIAILVIVSFLVFTGIIVGGVYVFKSAKVALNLSLKPENLSPGNRKTFHDLLEPPTPTPTLSPSPSTAIEDIAKATPSPVPAKVQIHGDDNCVRQTEAALALLQEKARVYLDLVNKYLGIVECAEKGTGVYSWEVPSRAIVGKDIVNKTMWHAGGLAHEACHVKLYRDYLEINPSSSVPIDIYSGRSAETQCLSIQRDALEKLGASQFDLDYLQNVINTDYWDIPVKDRWW